MKKRMPKREVLTPMEVGFVANFAGDATEAARLAGSKCPKQHGYMMLQRDRVKKAIAAKNQGLEQRGEIPQSPVAKAQHKALRQVGIDVARAVSINRDDIINGLVGIAQDVVAPPSARVTAYLGLADIFLLRVKNVRDINKFHGWTAEELEQYSVTGSVPERFRSIVGSSLGAEASLRTQKQ